MNKLIAAVCVVLVFSNCNKQESPPIASVFSTAMITADGIVVTQKLMDVNISPVISIKFSAPVDTNSAKEEVSLIDNQSNKVQVSYSFTSKDSIVILKPLQPLTYFSSFLVHVNGNLLSFDKGTLSNPGYNTLITKLDPSDKFPRISDNQLMDSVQRRTLRYFWDFGHPVSGMARERNTSGDIVTSGGTGFGIMAIVAGINRGFISRTEGRDRILKIVDFLDTKCTRYHGAFAHWINGSNGATVPFSTNDNGGDLVETSYLIQGLLAARQYFDQPDPAETSLRAKINAIWEGVEWDWYRKNNENALYWHWSADKGWIMNMRVQGWNETLITYITGSIFAHTFYSH